MKRWRKWKGKEKEERIGKKEGKERKRIEKGCDGKSWEKKNGKEKEGFEKGRKVRKDREKTGGKKGKKMKGLRRAESD